MSSTSGASASGSGAAGSGSGAAAAGGSPPSPSTAACAATELATFANAFERFNNGVMQLAAASQAAQKRLEGEFSSLDNCVKSHESQLKEAKKLQAMLEEIEKDNKSNPALSDYRLKLNLLRVTLDKLRDTKPRIDNGLFMRFMMGRVNMTLWKQADRIHFKDEYNKFKTRTTYLFLLWPLLQLLLMFVAPSFYREQGELLLKVHQLWLLYYYMTLSLRENILLVNGSSILHWWIYHHYCSMAISLLLILFPSRYLIRERILEMLTFGLVQGLVMLFQNNYQKRRLYTRKALGKAKAIDVESSETIVEKPTDLRVLVPMLFVLYAIELWFGVSFVHHFFHPPPALDYPVSILLQGVCFLVLALGNAWATGIVLVSKSKSRQLKQAVKERVTGRGSSVGGQGATPNATPKKEL